MTELSERLAEAEGAWGFHDASDERTAGYGHHMAQMLYRLPRDGQTDDMRVSIEQMLADLRDLTARLAKVEALRDCGPNGLRHYYAIDSTCQRCGMPSRVETALRAALASDATHTQNGTQA